MKIQRQKEEEAKNAIKNRLRGLKEVQAFSNFSSESYHQSQCYTESEG
jgi:hypothetical protein